MAKKVNAKKINVCLTFDFDAISVWIGTFHARSPSAISRGEFGKVGAERLLTHAARAEHALDLVRPRPHALTPSRRPSRQIAAAGHEIGHHGYFHDRPATPEDEARDFDRATAALKRRHRTGAASAIARRPPA